MIIIIIMMRYESRSGKIMKIFHELFKIHAVAINDPIVLHRIE